MPKLQINNPSQKISSDPLVDYEVSLPEVDVIASSLYNGISPRSINSITQAQTGYADDQGIIETSSLTEDMQQVPKQINYATNPDGEGLLEFQLPKYGYAQYINDMSAWQKQIREINGEIGWFYFKVFFNFNTEYGLLGGLLRKDGQVRINSANTAIKYLDSISSNYSYSKIADRKLALYKFGNVLKHISLDSPWFFKGITGLGDMPQPYTSEFQKERKINITCSEDAVDMRLGTLMDLYKYACFDNINCKEIIPRNLRKFEMSLIVMHVPLKFHHEPSIYTENGFSDKNIKGKGLDFGTWDFSSLASFKMFTFQNCEFDIEQLGAYYGDQMSNENPFSLGKNQLTIKYDRVFEHRMNEWNEFLLGDDGFYYNNTKLSNIDENDPDNILINVPNDGSKHQGLLHMMNSNHEWNTNALISYSEYFLNKVWFSNAVSMNHALGGSGRWSDLVSTFKNETSNITNKFNNMTSSFKNLKKTWEDVG